MKRFIFLAFCVSIGWTQLVYGNSQGTYVGYVRHIGKVTEYHLRFNFGIEQWENGKRAKELNEQWQLNCHYPSMFGGGPITYCSMNRTKFWPTPRTAVLRLRRRAWHSRGRRGTGD